MLGKGNLLSWFYFLAQSAFQLHLKNNNLKEMNQNLVNLIGLYSVDENPDVTLVELVINKKASDIEIGEFTQEIENQPRMNWQAPFFEKYLNLEGTKIIGDEYNLPKETNETTRLTFFIYFLDLNKSLLTPFGPLELNQKINKSKRITELIRFEDPE